MNNLDPPIPAGESAFEGLLSGYFTNEELVLRHFFAWYTPFEEEEICGEGSSRTQLVVSSTKPGITVALGMKIWTKLWAGPQLLDFFSHMRKNRLKLSERHGKFLLQLHTLGYITTRESFEEHLLPGGQPSSALFEYYSPDCLALLIRKNLLPIGESLRLASMWGRNETAKIICEKLRSHSSTPQEVLNEVVLGSRSWSGPSFGLHPMSYAFFSGNFDLMNILHQELGVTSEFGDRFLLNKTYAADLLPSQAEGLMKIPVVDRWVQLIKCGLDVSTSSKFVPTSIQTNREMFRQLEKSVSLIEAIEKDLIMAEKNPDQFLHDRTKNFIEDYRKVLKILQQSKLGQ